MSADDWRPPLVALIGFGMSRDDLIPRAEAWIARAQVLAAGERMLDAFPEHPGDRIVIGSPLEPVMEEISRRSLRERVAVLAAGDPLFYGVGRRLVEFIGAERLQVFPNVTAVQTLFARLGLPWDGVSIHSVHGRETDRWLKDFRHGRWVALLTDPHHNPAWVAAKVREVGISGGEMVVGENLGRSNERILRLTIDEAQDRDFEPLNITLLCPRPAGDSDQADDPPADPPIFGIADEAFQHRQGLITKREIRAVVLAHLQLKPGQVLWDLGAGSGSVSIEAARLTRLSRVAAVEKDFERYQELQRNIRRFACSNVSAYHGYAEEVLNRLPSPDRVFIGGSGGNLEQLLDKVWRCLKPAGLIVQTAVTFDTLERLRAFWRKRDRTVTIVQVQISRSVPILSSQRLEALNPVFVTRVKDDAS